MVTSIVLAVIGFTITIGIFLYNRKKDQKAGCEKRQAESEMRVSRVVDDHINTPQHIISGKSCFIRAGAALLQSEEEVQAAISRITARGLKNPIGEDYETLKEQNRLLPFLTIASRYAQKNGFINKSSEEIIKIMNEELGNV
ncbi:MAG: hypothetical protein SFW07_03640 [Gammaproteobacteria bacterium]|nr:hypothetical protein [Gammaproteobacteria bacterium]